MIGLICDEFFLLNLEPINFFIDLNHKLSDYSFCVWINELIVIIHVTEFTFI